MERPTCRMCVTACYDGYAYIWNVETGEKMLSIGEPEGWAESVQFTPDGSKILLKAAEAALWDTRTGEKLRSFLGNTNRMVISFFRSVSFNVAEYAGELYVD